jgi:predicted nucleic acid-binding protein
VEAAFWDLSSLIPLCIRQSTTHIARGLEDRFQKTVWWGTPVEMRGAFARLVRSGQLQSNEQAQALVRLDQVRRTWKEIEPSERLRIRAEDVIDRFSLIGADSFQLAAAWTWCLGSPRGRPFIARDVQLLDAARQLGFSAIEA